MHAPRRILSFWAGARAFKEQGRPRPASRAGEAKARWSTLHLLFACLALAPTAFAAESSPLSPDDALKSFQLADPQLHVELVAAEPLVASPCAIAWDEKGRLYVAENRGYPNTAQPPQGVIALLEDTDGDGRMDKRTVFADGLTFPNGVLPWRGGLIVTCAPDVLYLKDTDGDGHADERRVLLTGFDTKGSTQLRVNAPTLGADGWIYLAAGLSGGSVTAPSHPERAPVKMTSDVRFHPDTMVVENVDGRSQYGMSFDEYGRRFICMNRLPVQQVVLPSRWLRRNPQFPFSDTVQDCNERSVKSGLRGGNDGVRLFPISSNITTADSHAGSFSAACGVHVLSGGALTPRYRECALSCDPTGNLVHADRLEPQGAAFAAAPMFAGQEFLASRDDWFRPVYLAEGPDGALYVADMYRKVIEHPDYLPEEIRKRTDFESGKDRGRIWRVRAEGVAGGRAARFPLEPSPRELVPILATQEGWARATAARLLVEQKGEPVHRALREAAGADEVSARQWLGLLPALARCGIVEPADLQRAWDAGDASLRALVLRLWLENPGARAWKPDPAVLDHDADGEVRAVAALALGEMPEGGPALGELAAQNPDDRWLRAAVLSSVTGREAEFMRELIGHTERPSAGMLEMLEVTAKSYDTYTKLVSEFGPAKEGERSPGPSLIPFQLAQLLGLSERTHHALTEEWEGSRLTSQLEAAARMAEHEANPVLQTLGIRVLGHGEWARAQKPLTNIIDSAGAQEIRFAAIRALAGFAEPDVPRLLLAPGKWTHYSPVEREVVLSALLVGPAHLSGVLEAIDAGNLPAASIPTVRRAAFLKAKDAALRARAEKLWSTPPADRQKAFEAAKAVLALKADPRHGREVFKNVCATCHRLDREGFAVGPDLLDMRNQPKESILFHIVIPEAEVNVTYAPYLAETKDGRTFAGILASESPASVTLRMPLGAEEPIARTNLAKLEALPGSLMPSGLEQAMSRQELADLLAYLKGE